MSNTEAIETVHVPLINETAPEFKPFVQLFGGVSC
jgi:hypothetical protein